MDRKFAYARVSTDEQNLDRQIEALLPYVDNDRKHIIAEKESGKNIEDRKKLLALMVLLDAGDALYVTSLDRLGRKKEDIKEVLKTFDSKGVSVRILDLPTTMLDARDEITAATIKMVNGVLIDVLGYVAETERNFIRKRQAEGIAVAKAKGKHLGRKPKPLPAAWEADMAEWKAGKCTATSLFKKYNFAPATFYEKVRRWEAGEIAVEPDKGDSAVKKTTDQV